MSQTDLSGFPMVMAVSKDAINAQLAKVYGQSTHENATNEKPTKVKGESTDKVEMFPHVPWNLGPKDESWILDVTQFAAPTVDFNTTIKMGCRMLMTIMKGQFTTWVFKGMKNGKPEMEKQNISLDGLTMYLTTPMKQVKHDKWHDVLFEVQALYADLENMHSIEFHLSKDMKLAVLGQVESSLETVFADYIRNYGRTHPHALLFGAVKVPPVADTIGLLKPSAVAYTTTNVKSENDAPLNGYLNYLLWTDVSASIPTGDSAGAFNVPLARSGAPATFVISEATVLETIAGTLVRKDQDFANADLVLTRGVFGSPEPRAVLSLNSEISFGVKLNDRDRSAQLKTLNATIVDGKIKINYRIHTSVYGAFKDIDITVDACRDVTVYLDKNKVKVKVGLPYDVHYDEDWGSTWDDFDKVCQFALWHEESYGADLISNINLPGCAVWRFESVEIDSDRQMYLTATYA
jgi:hypothetical protein